MTDLKDQIRQKIQQERERSQKPDRSTSRNADAAKNRLTEIRPRLDEMSHATDKYSLKVDYAKGPYNTDIAVMELYRANGVWAAAWQIATAEGGSGEYWEVTYHPRGVETQHKWFRHADDLFDYLTASVAERVVELDDDA